MIVRYYCVYYLPVYSYSLKKQVLLCHRGKFCAVNLWLFIESWSGSAGYPAKVLTEVLKVDASHINFRFSIAATYCGVQLENLHICPSLRDFEFTNWKQDDEQVGRTCLFPCGQNCEEFFLIFLGVVIVRIYQHKPLYDDQTGTL